MNDVDNNIFHANACMQVGVHFNIKMWGLIQYKDEILPV